MLKIFKIESSFIFYLFKKIKLFNYYLLSYNTFFHLYFVNKFYYYNFQNYIKKKNKKFFFSNNIKYLNHFKNFLFFFIDNCFLKFWIYNFKIKGLGYKLNKLKILNQVFFKINLGFSHFFYFKLAKFYKFFFFGKKKKNFLILNMNKFFIKNILFNILKLKKFDNYKGKGFRFINYKYIFKIGKKSVW